MRHADQPTAKDGPLIEGIEMKTENFINDADTIEACVDYDDILYTDALVFSTFNKCARFEPIAKQVANRIKCMIWDDQGDNPELIY